MKVNFSCSFFFFFSNRVELVDIILLFLINLVIFVKNKDGRDGIIERNSRSEIPNHLITGDIWNNQCCSNAIFNCIEDFFFFGAMLEWNIRIIVLSKFFDLLFLFWYSFGFLVKPNDGLLMDWSEFIKVLKWHLNKCESCGISNDFIISIIFFGFNIDFSFWRFMDICDLETEIWKQQNFFLSGVRCEFSIGKINVCSSSIRITQEDFKDHDFIIKSRLNLTILLSRLFIEWLHGSNTLLLGTQLE